jgi:hypothetical protein
LEPAEPRRRSAQTPTMRRVTTTPMVKSSTRSRLISATTMSGSSPKRVRPVKAA